MNVLSTNSSKLFYGIAPQLHKLFSVNAVIFDLGIGFFYFTFNGRSVYIYRLT